MTKLEQNKNGKLNKSAKYWYESKTTNVATNSTDSKLTQTNKSKVLKGIQNQPTISEAAVNRSNQISKQAIQSRLQCSGGPDRQLLIPTLWQMPIQMQSAEECISS